MANTRSTSSKTFDTVPFDLNDFESINKSLNEVSGLIESMSPKSTFEKDITKIVGNLKQAYSTFSKQLQCYV